MFGCASNCWSGIISIYVTKIRLKRRIREVNGYFEETEVGK